MKNVDTLVFEGGSVKGLAYVGALEVLDLYSRQLEGHKSFLDQIKRIAGTSAGSIMALLIALNLNLEQIKIVMQNTSFASFADITSWYAYGNIGKGASIYNNGYLCEGKAFHKWVKKILRDYAGNEAITFSELQSLSEKNGKPRDLHVYAVRLNDNQTIAFNAKETPNVSVALAIRMSMSIPVFFKPVRVTEDYDDNNDSLKTIRLNEEAGTSYYVDGGVKINYPYPLIREFIQTSESNLSNEEIDEKILGFKVDSQEEIFHNAVMQPNGSYLKPLFRKNIEIQEGFGFHLVPRMLTSLMSSQDDMHNKNPTESSRTIRCSDCNVSTFDFNLDKEKIKKLLTAGAEAAQKFITIMTIKPNVIASSHANHSFLKATTTTPSFAIDHRHSVDLDTPSISAENEFARKYIESETERMSDFVQQVEQSLADRNNEPLDQEEQKQYDALKIDKQRLQETRNLTLAVSGIENNTHISDAEVEADVVAFDFNRDGEEGKNDRDFAKETTKNRDITVSGIGKNTVIENKAKVKVTTTLFKFGSSSSASNSSSAPTPK